MRSTLEIIIAVKESQPVTEEELRMALLALSGIDHFRSGTINQLIESIESKAQLRIDLAAGFAKQQRESLFKAMKKDPVEWLGPGNLPGNPEYEERVKWARRVYEKATGEKL